MKRLVLTTRDSSAGGIGAAGLADFVIVLGRRLVWGPPLSQAQLGAYFMARTTQEAASTGKITRPRGRWKGQAARISG
jgi:hypothetical protein